MAGCHGWGTPQCRQLPAVKAGCNRRRNAGLAVGRDSMGYCAAWCCDASMHNMGDLGGAGPDPSTAQHSRSWEGRSMHASAAAQELQNPIRTCNKREAAACTKPQQLLRQVYCYHPNWKKTQIAKRKRGRSLHTPSTASAPGPLLSLQLSSPSPPGGKRQHRSAS